FGRFVFKCIFVFICVLAVSAIGYLFYTDFWFRFAWAVVLYIVFSGFVSWLAVYLLRNKLGKSPEIPGGNILIEYLKAKKAKICPLIEYVD
ncbi:hypothetical protein LCGC14_1052430, partial [marine sediment metagenome]